MAEIAAEPAPLFVFCSINHNTKMHWSIVKPRDRSRTTAKSTLGFGLTPVPWQGSRKEQNKRFRDSLRLLGMSTRLGAFWAMLVSGGYMFIHADPRGTL